MTKKSVLKGLNDLIAIDPRALAAFRIAFGLVLFFDFLTKSFDLTAFYTDLGILPRSLAIDNLGWWSFSFHMASGSFWFQALLMAAGGLMALSLVAGYQTRVVSFGLWIFVVSLQNRNHLILHSGDALIRLLLFWSMFLPLGRIWSFDSLVARPRRPSETLVSRLASAGILLQMLSIYFFTALLKNHPQWNQEFTALYYALSLEQFTTGFGRMFLSWPGLMKFLTASTYYLEFSGPIILILPFLSRYTRLLIPPMFMGLHVGLAATMNLGLFPWTCLAGWILFLPESVWDRIPSDIPKMRAVAAMILKNLPEPYVGQSPRWGKVVAAALLLFAMLSVSVWNVLTLPQFKTGVPSWIRSVALPLRLDQYWCMFAPYPMRGDGWFVVDGTLKDGTSIDTWLGNEPVNWDKPDDLFVGFRSTQWRKYLGNLWLDEKEPELQLAFGKYVCREWNRLGPKREDGRLLEKYELYYMREQTPPPGETALIKQVFLWRHQCFSNPDKTAPLTPPVIKN